MSQTFSSRVRETREKRGMNQSALANLLGITPTAVWNWEQGNSTPRPPMMVKLCQVLGVDENYLTDGQTLDNSARVDDILDDAKAAIAATLGVHPDKLTLSLTFVV